MVVAEELALDRLHHRTPGVALGQKRPVNFVSSLNHSHFEIRDETIHSLGVDGPSEAHEFAAATLYCTIFETVKPPALSLRV